MNVDYWLPDSEERDYKLSDIPSPADMAKAIQRVREIHMRFWLDEPYCSECHSYEVDEKYASYPCPTIRALDGAQ